MKWSTVRGFGNVHYFNVSYLVLFAIPVLATICSEINQFNFDLILPMRLKVVYAASICYTIAIAVYQYRCPHVIKLYETELDYVEAAYPVYLRAHPDRKVEIVLANLLEHQQEIRERIANALRELKSSVRPANDPVRQELETVVESVYESCIQRHLVREYTTAQTSNRVAMWVSFIFYIAGTLLMIGFLIERSVTVFTS